MRIRDRSTTIAASTATTSLPNGRIVTALFAGALFLSAFLLFVLEPMVAKSILPTLGGTPMVWNTRLRGTEVRIEFVRWLCPGYLVPYSQTTSVRFVAKTTGLSGLQRELAFKPFSKMRGLRAGHRAIADSK